MNEEEIKNIIDNIVKCKDEEYDKLYPQINCWNVFSISTLAYSTEKQINYKLHKYENHEPSYRMAYGKAIHEFFQKRLKNLGYNTEYGLSFSNDRYTLLGHIDAINFSNNIILEFKTTHIPHVSEAMLKSYILQAGTYAYIIEMKTNQKFDTFVIVINDHLTVYKLSENDKQNAFTEIINRAEHVYNELQKVYKDSIVSISS